MKSHRMSLWVVIVLTTVAAVLFAVPVWAEDQYGSPQSTAGQDKSAELSRTGNGNGNGNGQAVNNSKIERMHVGTLDVDEVKVQNLIIMSGMTQAQARSFRKERAEVGRRGNGGAGAARPSGPIVDQTARASASAAATAAKKAQSAATAAKKSADSANAALGDWNTTEEGTVAANIRSMSMYVEQSAELLNDWNLKDKKGKPLTVAGAIKALDQAGRDLSGRVNGVEEVAKHAASQGIWLFVVAGVLLLIVMIILEKLIDSRHGTAMTHHTQLEGRVATLETHTGLTPAPPAPPAPGGGGPTIGLGP